MGTGFGNAAQFNTVNTAFVREDASNPAAVMAVYYDSARGLQKRGIQLKTKRGYDYSNNPFPAYTPGAKPPSDWQG